MSIVLLGTACSGDESDASGPTRVSGASSTTSATGPDATGPDTTAPDTTGDATVPDTTGDATVPEPSEETTIEPSPQPRPDPVARRVAAMSLRDKARQLLVLPFRGTTAPTALIRRYHPAGLIYFSENLRSNDQVAELSRESQQVSRATGEPLLVMTDQEGGTVTRIPGTSETPAGSDFGGDARLARSTAQATGAMLDSLGINVDLAPVADVNTVGDAGVIGSRSFSSDPEVASRLTAAQVCGYHSGGVAAAAKHFPGHGSTTTDSHLEVVTIQRTLGGWRQIDKPPFVAATQVGVDLMLVGHLSVPSLDPAGRPATLSGPMLRGQLRQRIGFDGVIITDSLIMEGITAYGDSGTLAVRAVRAGVDLLLMPADPAAAVDGIVAAVRDGRISKSRLDATVTRVLTLKRTLGLYRAEKSLPGC